MRFGKWERLTVVTPDGKPHEAVAPVILSVSRATDIPALYPDWFMARWRAGFTPWTNPYNGKTTVVSFARVRAIVFWTKNPAPLLPHLDALDAACPNYYFQFTLNDYDAEGLEPGLPPLEARLATFRRLAGRLGPDRVVWRFDPLILVGGLSSADLARKVGRLAPHLAGLTHRLVFSFADVANYRGVRSRLARAGLSWREFTPAERGELALALADCGRRTGLEVMTCAEPESYAHLGIAPGRCVDDVLLARLFPYDTALMAFLGKTGQEPAHDPGLKDRGQRKACGCIASKDVGAYGSCRLGCAYCYAQ